MTCIQKVFLIYFDWLVLHRPAVLVTRDLWSVSQVSSSRKLQQCSGSKEAKIKHWNGQWRSYKLESMNCKIGDNKRIKIMVQIFSQSKLFNLDFALSCEELPLIINWSIKVHLSITRYFYFQFGDSSWGRFGSRRCECGQCDQPRHQHPSSSSEILELSLVIVTFQLSKIIFTVLTNKKCFQTVGK